MTTSALSPSKARGGVLDVSIVILARNEAHNLARSLPLVADQKFEGTYELIGIDTDSDDATPELLHKHGARIFKVSHSDFHHVRTRLFGIAQARAPFVVFLVADAFPINEFWLQALVQPLLDDPLVAATYSRQLPAPGCVPWEARDILAGGSVVREVKQVDWSNPFAIENYHKHFWKYIAFSDVSSCYRKELLKDIPIPEGLSEVEDQYWCKCLLEKGYKIILEPTSIVVHSHNDSMRRLYKRQKMYGRCFAIFSDAQPERLSRLVCHALEASVNDLFFDIARRDGGVLARLKWAIQIPLVRFVKRLGYRQGIVEGIAKKRPLLGDQPPKQV
jgi:rhamnosyltransferase